MKLLDFFGGNLALLAFVFFISGCATVDYIGDTYAPTQHVEMYFDKADIPRPHKVMGQMTVEENEFADTSELQEEMKKEAMARGADAVLFTGMQKIETGVTSNWQDLGKTKGKHPYQYGTSTAQIQHNKQITGSLLKYTDLPPSQNAVPS